jgi:hypothetical protein
MSAIKHSTGPWEERGTLVWSRGMYVADCSHASVPYEQQSANASLIAAAPELLAELKHLVHWFDQLRAEDVVRAKAAILKATGSEQW